MKSRKVIVATLMASASCAWAQSNVTVYGSVDAAVGAVKQSSGTASPGGGAVSAGRSSTQLDSGVGPGSRLGFRGTEDLGGGLKALFALEAGIGVDTGSFQQGGLAFGRQAYVGLGGTNWSVTAGRQYAPMDPAFAMSDALGGSYWGNVLVNSGHIIYGGLGAVTGGGAYQTPSRVDNSILASSTFGPISASIMIAAGNEDDKKSGRLASLGLTYMAGPLQINGVYTRLYQNAEAILPTAKPELLTEYLLGGSYDFGVAKLFAGYYGFEGPKNSANLSISVE